MSCAGQIKELLRPMGVYRLEGTVNGGELEAMGSALDACAECLETAEREMLLVTAEGPGLEAIECLLTRRPVADTLKRRRAALAALLRISGDSFTLNAINDNLAGCGLNAKVNETNVPGTVEVRFPEVPGIPEGFEEMRRIIEDILPCHLLVRYVYWYVTWALMEQKFHTWGALENSGLSWNEIEKAVR